MMPAHRFGVMGQARKFQGRGKGVTAAGGMVFKLSGGKAPS